MKIIQNIKFQYQVKYLEDLFQNSQYSKIHSHLKKYCHKNPNQFLSVIKKFLPEILKITSEEKILADNLILINSFNVNDSSIVTSFIDFYLKKVNFIEFEISDYQKELAIVLSKINKDKKISPEDMFQNSMYYQSILTYLKKDIIQFLTNQFAFFSTNNDLNFTNTRLTKCYFLLIEHPYKVYQRYKNKLKSKDLALNEFLNLDNKPITYNYENLNMMVTRKDWNTYNSSWSDPNVTNTLRGVFLKKEEYLESPDEFFASIIMHLRQSGYDIPLNYSLIAEYVSNKVNLQEHENIHISNHEKKFLKKQIESVSEHFGYDL